MGKQLSINTARNRGLRRGWGLMPPAALGLALVGACISPESEVLEVTEECDELNEVALEELELDPEAERFIVASREISASIDRVSDDVLEACASMALDLGADDTWSGYDALRDRISNDADDGACDVALQRVDERLGEASSADVDLRVAVTAGECRVDFDAQAASCSPTYS